MALLEELQEGPIKQRDTKGSIIERYCPPCSWTRESIVTNGRIRFYCGYKIGALLTIVCISYLNTKLIIASFSQSFPVQLPDIDATSLKLPIAIGRTCHLRTNDNDDVKGKDIPRYTVRATDYLAYKSILVLDMTAAETQPSYKQQQHPLFDAEEAWSLHIQRNLLASVGDQEVTRFLDINSFRSYSVKTLRSLRHLPLFSYSNTRVKETPKQAEVVKFKDLKKNDFNCSAVHASRNEKGRSHLNANAALQVKKEYVLLPAATLLAIVMFTAACRFPRFITKANYIYNYDTGRIVQEERDLTITSSFILFNSTGFIVSLAIVISILRGFPLKPWPQISVTMLFGSYMCLIMKILPLESWLVLFLSVPLLLLAAAGKLCDFAE
ncbi:unnamed protein product [Withania somnifera]